jgi:hypothetical protein
MSSNIFCGLRVDCIEESGGSIEFVNNCWWTFLTAGPDACEWNPWSDIESDPLFCNVGYPWDFDWRLQEASPCIGTGEGGTNMGALGVGCSLLDVAEPASARRPTLRALPHPLQGSSGVITFAMDMSGPVVLTLFDTAGREVRRLLDGAVLGAGEVRIPFDVTSAGHRTVAPGIYLLRLETATEEVVRKITITN